MLPSLSVLVPTYGRTRVLGECVESFLRQEYAGHAEMVILNDHPLQTLVLDPTVFDPLHPITIINASERSPELGTKRNTLVDVAAFDHLFFWDDDDIYLPWALTAAAELYLKRKAQGRRCSRPSHCFQLQAADGPSYLEPSLILGDGDELILRDSGALWTVLVEKAAVRAAGGFPPHARNQDVSLVRALVQRQWMHGECNTPGMPFFLRRLSGPYPHQVDVPWTGAQDNDSAQLAHTEAVHRMILEGDEPIGQIGINPGWARDYEGLCRQLWYRTDPVRVLPRPRDAADA